MAVGLQKAYAAPVPQETCGEMFSASGLGVGIVDGVIWLNVWQVIFQDIQVKETVFEGLRRRVANTYQPDVQAASSSLPDSV